METTDVQTDVTEYTISPLPEGHDAWSSFAIKVKYRGNGMWSINRSAFVLSRYGDWDVESRDAIDDDEWRYNHRFDLKEALKIAKDVAPHTTVNGYTLDQVKEMSRR